MRRFLLKECPLEGDRPLLEGAAEKLPEGLRSPTELVPNATLPSRRVIVKTGDRQNQ